MWTVLDADYRPVAEAASFLEHLRLGRDAAEGTCRMYAGELALYRLFGSKRGVGHP